VTWAILGGIGLLGVSAVTHAQNVRCHISYAGATRTLAVSPIARAEDVEPQLQGTSFVFKVVNKVAPFEEDAVRITTYTTWQGQTLLLHQASYRPTPVSTSENSKHGFTGLQAVREPLRGNELRYWCETDNPIRAAAR
jgi:hypothetical protein